MPHATLRAVIDHLRRETDCHPNHVQTFRTEFAKAEKAIEEFQATSSAAQADYTRENALEDFWIDVAYIGIHELHKQTLPEFIGDRQPSLVPQVVVDCLLRNKTVDSPVGRKLRHLNNILEDWPAGWTRQLHLAGAPFPRIPSTAFLQDTAKLARIPELTSFNQVLAELPKVLQDRMDAQRSTSVPRIIQPRDVRKYAIQICSKNVGVSLYKEPRLWPTRTKTRLRSASAQQSRSASPPSPDNVTARKKARISRNSSVPEVEIARRHPAPSVVPNSPSAISITSSSCRLSDISEEENPQLPEESFALPEPSIADEFDGPDDESLEQLDQEISAPTDSSFAVLPDEVSHIDQAVQPNSKKARISNSMMMPSSNDSSPPTPRKASATAQTAHQRKIDTAKNALAKAKRALESASAELQRQEDEIPNKLGAAEGTSVEDAVKLRKAAVQNIVDDIQAMAEKVEAMRKDMQTKEHFQNWQLPEPPATYDADMEKLDQEITELDDMLVTYQTALSDERAKQRAIKAAKQALTKAIDQYDHYVLKLQADVERYRREALTTD